MSRLALTLALLAASSALAAKPRGGERVEPLATLVVTEPPKDPTRVLSFDLGLGLWSSTLVTVPALEVAVGVGWRLTRHFLLKLELDVGAGPYPSTRQSLLVRFGLTGGLGWDVMELVRRSGKVLPLELGPELSLGANFMTGGGSLGFPLVRLGVFGRYVFTPGVSFGVQLRSYLPYWSYMPPAFSGDRFIGPGFLEPGGVTLTASFIHTY